MRRKLCDREYSLFSPTVRLVSILSIPTLSRLLVSGESDQEGRLRWLGQTEIPERTVTAAFVPLTIWIQPRSEISHVRSRQLTQFIPEDSYL